MWKQGRVDGSAMCVPPRWLFGEVWPEVAMSKFAQCTIALLVDLLR